MYLADDVWLRFRDDETVTLVRGEHALPLSRGVYMALARAMDGRRTRSELESVLKEVSRASERSTLDRLQWLGFVSDQPSPSSMQDPSLAAEPGDVPIQLNTYRILRRIGRGGYGEIFEALDMKRGTCVALKILRRASSEAVEAFRRESRAVYELAHPSLIASHELATARGRWFFVMDLIAGEPFTRPLGPERWANAWSAERERAIRDALGQLADAVSSLHAAGFLHLDLKPDNVLLRSDGRVAVLDFGLARVVGAESDSPSGGSLSYAAPEQLAGHPEEASDWYAVGVLLNEALTGRLPDKSPDGERPAPAGIPHDLAELCRALLARDPRQRPAAAQVLEATGRASSAPRRTAPDFVGRSTELSMLERAVFESRRASVAISILGDPGVGKTALVEELSRRLANRPD